MAIAGANLTAAHDSTDKTAGQSYATASVNFVTGRLYLLTVRGRSATAPTIGSISGGCPTWTLVNSEVSLGTLRIWVYWGIATSTAASAVTITTDGASGTWTQAGWSVDEFTGAHASAPIVQSQNGIETASHTTFNIALAAFGDANNATFLAAAQNSDSIDLVPAGSLSGLGLTTNAAENVNRIETFYQASAETNPGVTCSSTTADIFGVACEIALAAVGGATQAPRSMHQDRLRRAA